MSSPRAISLVALFLLAVPTAAQRAGAELPWPEFRGPTRDGRAVGTIPPAEWGEEKNVRWKTAIRGEGWSSPVVGGGRVWLTTATEEGRKLWVVAVDAKSGAIVHERVLFEVEKPQPKNALNSHASPSPVLGDGRVWVHFGTYGTACLDAEKGDELWQRRDINCDHEVGPGSSPILHDGLLIFNVDGTDVQFVTALDAKTGRTVWKTPRSVDLSGLAGERRKAYSTPVVISVGDGERLISTGAEATVAYAPETGEELWRVRHAGFSTTSRPVFGNGVLFLNTGFMRPSVLAVKPEGEGDVTETAQVWTYTRSVPTMSSPLLVDGRLYFVNDSGTVTCLDAGSGERLWRERIEGSYSASPVFADGRIYFFSREGLTVVVAATEEYRALAENRLDAGFMASPAVLDRAFILRTKTHLYRIEEPERVQ